MGSVPLKRDVLAYIIHYKETVFCDQKCVFPLWEGPAASVASCVQANLIRAVEEMAQV